MVEALCRPCWAVALSWTGIALTGCVEPAARGDGAFTADGTEVAAFTIDSGAGLELDEGTGVGLGVAYEGDGWWWVATVCDTQRTGESCRFDVLCSTDDAAGLLDFERVDLEMEDELFFSGAFALQALFVTHGRSDAMRFRAEPGATVRLSALLYDPDVDGQWIEDPRLVNWVGGGGLHQGAPESPIDLSPDMP